MRVLTITSSYPKFAGDTTAPFVESISRALVERGHELTIVLPARDDLSPSPLEGARFVPYRYAPVKSVAVFGYAEALREDTALRSAAYVAAPLALASGARSLLREASRAEYDVLHAHWVVPNGFMAIGASRARALPLVVSLHGSDVFLSESRRAVRWAAGRAFARASGATACSADLAARSVPLGAREPPEVIPYGVDTGRFRPGSDERRRRARRARGLSEDDWVVLGVGRLVRKKGFEFLVEGMAKLGDRGRLVLAGKGDLEEELLARARACGVGDRVQLLGDVDRDALPDLYAAADLVAVPSVRDEAGNVDGLPNVLLEAMASGKPIVASRVAGIPEAIRDGRDGILVPERDASAIAAAIGRIARSSELASSLADSARRRALESFSWKLAGERFERVLRSVSRARPL